MFTNEIAVCGWMLATLSSARSMYSLEASTAVILPPRLNTITLWAKSNGEVQPWELSAKQGGATCMVFAVTHLCAASNKLAD